MKKYSIASIIIKKLHQFERKKQISCGDRASEWQRIHPTFGLLLIFFLFFCEIVNCRVEKATETAKVQPSLGDAGVSIKIEEACRFEEINLLYQQGAVSVLLLDSAIHTLGNYMKRKILLQLVLIHCVFFLFHHGHVIAHIPVVDFAVIFMPQLFALQEIATNAKLSVRTGE